MNTFNQSARKSATRTMALIAGAAVLAMALSACNTVEGAGRDIKSTGKAIEKSADDNK